MYLDVLWFLNFVVDFLLLIATNRLSGYPTVAWRTLLAAVFGGLYGSVCVLPGFLFLAGTVWRVVFLLLIGVLAFGANRDSVRRCVLFTLLSMASGGIALGLGCGGAIAVILCAVFVCAMCMFGLRGRVGKRFLPVEIRYGGKSYRFHALIDTGNSLVDPITGQQALVVSSKLGHLLLGNAEIEFSDPVKMIENIKGGRLIPYHTVGHDGGLMAGKYFRDVTIGRWRGSCLVAFSPQEIGRGEAYEALTGGIS